MDITIQLINMNKMIDTHSHILYGIDDGAPDILESINIIKEFINLGFEAIILTPHYRSYYTANNEVKRARLNILNEEIKRLNLDIKLYLANEVKITSNLEELIKNDIICLLGNNLFLELPFSQKIHNLDRIVYDLEDKGINVIIVHPERYNYYKNEDLEKLLDLGVEFQCNYESITGKYGRDAKKKVKELLKNKMVTYLGSDVHYSQTLMVKKFDKIKKDIIKIVGESTYQDLVYNNIKKVIDELQ